jgi:hypothetical protein
VFQALGAAASAGSPFMAVVTAMGCDQRVRRQELTSAAAKPIAKEHAISHIGVLAISVQTICMKVICVSPCCLLPTSPLWFNLFPWRCQ